jgi:hypothetical protein
LSNGFLCLALRSRKKAMDKGTRNCSEANFVRRPYAENHRKSECSRSVMILEVEEGVKSIILY